jgi:4-hydroxy-4-methyl-2-oxoglutarate aldolase
VTRNVIVIQDGTRAGGTAVTALCWPGDNLMIHAAAEQCRAGDLLVVTTTSPCTDGMFGELLATSLAARGVRGIVIEAGLRDVADLRAMGFPAWSAAISAQGTVKATPGAVNVPVSVGGQIIHPGDAIIADDGVVCVPRGQVSQALAAGRARVATEEQKRQTWTTCSCSSRSTRPRCPTGRTAATCQRGFASDRRG